MKKSDNSQHPLILQFTMKDPQTHELISITTNVDLEYDEAANKWKEDKTYIRDVTILK